MRIVKIASLSESKKVAYNVAGEKSYIPERFRSMVAVGMFMLVATQTINTSKKDADGNPITENGQIVLSGETAQRETVTFVGDFKGAVSAKNEEKILAKAEDLYVSKLADEQAVELGLSVEELTAAI